MTDSSEELRQIKKALTYSNAYSIAPEKIAELMHIDYAVLDYDSLEPYIVVDMIEVDLCTTCGAYWQCEHKPLAVGGDINNHYQVTDTKTGRFTSMVNDYGVERTIEIKGSI